MKKIWLYLLFYPALGYSQATFDTYFSQENMRVDFILAGNYETTQAYFQTVRREPFWGGSEINLIDTLDYGSCRFMVYSDRTGQLIFSAGFSTLYHEWKTTPEARNLNRGFYQTVQFPFPREKVLFELFERDNKRNSKKILSVKIDPDDYFIQPSPTDKYEVVNLLKSGDPSKNVDLVFLPEGYKKDEMGKFLEDVRRLSDFLFTTSPFNLWKDRFTVSAVLAPSVDSGSDIPGKGTWRNTIMNSTFYTFDMERYLTTSDYWKVRDLAALVPYDQICILVNTPKYGGGAIYNHYNISSVDQNFSQITFIHEFGHGFAGLGDEYYESDVAYQSFYDLSAEPWEPNLTTLVDFSRKWKDLLKPGTPVPTPDIESFRNEIGVFEGGGYTAKGVFRPQVNCWMKGFRSDGFCVVCEKSIEKMIRWYTD